MKRYLFLLFAVMLLGLAVDSARGANPTQQARYIAFKSVTATSIDLTFTRGNGAQRIVVVSETPFEVNPASDHYKAPADSAVYNQGTKGLYKAPGQSVIGKPGFMDGYVVYNSSQPGNTNTERSLLITGLTSGTTYYIHIFEYNTPATPDYTTLDAQNNPAYTYTAPLAPAITQGADLLSHNGFLALWDQPDGGIDLYDFQLKDGFNGTGVNYYDDPGYADFNAPANDMPFDDLTANHAYSYRVRAVKGYRYSAWTDWHNVQTLPTVVVTGDTDVCQHSTITYTVNQPTGGTLVFGEWRANGTPDLPHPDLNPSTAPWLNTNSITWNSVDNDIEVTTTFRDNLYPDNVDLCNTGKIGHEADFTELENSLYVDVVAAPQPIAEMVGTQTPCEGADVTYTVANQPGATFRWILNDTTVVEGESDSLLHFAHFPAAGVITSIGVYAYAGTCATDTIKKTITVKSLPSTPASITMPEAMCIGSTATFSTAVGLEGETFNWTIPAGWSWDPTDTTHSDNVAILIVGADTGSITVSKHNDCGNGSAFTHHVDPTPIATGFTIQTADTTVCEGSSMTFRVVPPTPNNFPGTTFAWSVENGYEGTGTDWTGTGTDTTFTITAAGKGRGIVILTPTYNSCEGEPVTLIVTGNPIPTGGEFTVSEFENRTTVCSGSEQTYTIYNADFYHNYHFDGVDTSYNWQIPAGWSLVDSVANSITFTIDTNYASQTQVDIKLTPKVGTCGTERKLTVTINPLPIVAGTAAIIGEDTVCENSSDNNYSVSGINNAVTYIWTAPTGWNHGEDSTGSAIVYALAPEAEGGFITVRGVNDCGTSVDSIKYAVTVNLTPTDYAFVDAVDTACTGSHVGYKVSGSHANGFDWEVVATDPDESNNGWSLATVDGHPDSVIVTVGIGTANIACSPKNGSCYCDPIAQGVIALQLPSSVVINGSSAVCKSTAGFAYSVSGTNLSSQVWSISGDGWSITSPTDTGSTIVVTSGTGTGTLTVTPSNGFCAGTAINKTITVNDPPAGTNIAVTSPVCAGSVQTYILTGRTNHTDSTEYNWTLPSGWDYYPAGTEQTTDTIHVTAGTIGGRISCSPSNGDCSGALVTSDSVVVNALPASYTFDEYPVTVCQASVQTYSVDGGSGADHFEWTLPSGWTFNPPSPIQTTASISVKVSENGGNLICKPISVDGCAQATADTALIEVAPLPLDYTMTTAPLSVCEGSTQTYAVSGGQYGSSFDWTLPEGWSWAGADANHSDSVAIVVVGSASDTIFCTPVSAQTCRQATPASAVVTVNPLPIGYTMTTAPLSVCQRSTQTYVVSGGQHGNTYNWTLPSGWTWASADANHTDSIAIVVVGTTGDSITCRPVSANGCNQLASAKAIVTVNPLPINYTMTTAPSPVCENSTHTYIVSGGTNGATYNWTLPPHWTWAEADANHTDSVAIVVVGNEGGTIYCKPVSANGCYQADSASALITVRFLPAGTITGPTTACQGSTNSTYSIANGSNITNRSWSVSGTGWSGTSTDATFTPTVGSDTGTVHCTISNGSCTISELTYKVTVNKTATASAIEGNTTPCRGNEVTYYLADTSNLTSTSWTVPTTTGWSLLEQDKYHVTVTIGSDTGTISAVLSNGTCVGHTYTLKITKINDVPANAGNIQGVAAPCVASNQEFSVVAKEGVSYRWSYPETWTNVSGDTTSTLHATVTGSGTVTVIPWNGCGDGTSSQFAVNVTTIPGATSAIEGLNTVTPPGLYYCSVINVPGVTYTWAAPSGWTINPETQGLNSVVFSVASGAVSGNVTVTPSNDCGVSTSTTEKYVTVNNGPPTQPAGQVTNIVFSDLTCNSVRLTWTIPTSGAGNGRIVVAKQGSSPSNPVDLTNYVANSIFGRAASQIGTTGTYVVYKTDNVIGGDPNTCVVTGLTRGTMYYFKVLEYNYNDYNLLGNGYNYNPNPAYLNPRSVSTRTACKEVESISNPYSEIGLFSARSANGNGYLGWNTQYEQNVLGYEISRLCLTDKEENFTVVSSYETNLDLVAENMNSNKDYKLTDKGVAVGKKYIYRLSYVGADGVKNDVSEKELTIEGSTTANGALTVSDVKPNPVKESVNFDVTTNEEVEARFEIINMNGEVVATANSRIKGTVLMNMPLDLNVPSGSYMLKVTAGTETAVTRFVVVK